MLNKTEKKNRRKRDEGRQENRRESERGRGGGGEMRSGNEPRWVGAVTNVVHRILLQFRCVVFHTHTHQQTKTKRVAFLLVWRWQTWATCCSWWPPSRTACCPCWTGSWASSGGCEACTPSSVSSGGSSAHPAPSPWLSPLSAAHAC